jgi:hypothetical protein
VVTCSDWFDVLVKVAGATGERRPVTDLTIESWNLMRDERSM